MTEAQEAQAHGAHGAHGDEALVGHGTRRSYLIGFALAALLTALPFWLVMGNVLGDASATTIAVIALAVLQILVHTVCFLHVTRRVEGGWVLVATVFTAVIVLIVISGSLWIFYHLNGNMMPMGASGGTM